MKQIIHRKHVYARYTVQITKKKKKKIHNTKSEVDSQEAIKSLLKTIRQQTQNYNPKVSCLKHIHHINFKTANNSSLRFIMVANRSPHTNHYTITRQLFQSNCFKNNPQTNHKNNHNINMKKLIKINLMKYLLHSKRPKLDPLIHLSMSFE